MGLCKCGCGKDVKNDYAKGHWLRTNPFTKEDQLKASQKQIGMKKKPREGGNLCECGCGQLCVNRFRPGHNPTWNKGLTKETSEIIRKSAKALSKSTKGEKVGGMLGKYHSEETKEKIRQSNLGRKISEDTRRKLSESHMGNKPPHTGKPLLCMRGVNNPNWKGGSSGENATICGRIEYKLWRKSVFERDDYTCQKCGERGGKLRAHHIFSKNHYKQLRIVQENGITFCESCHRNFHSIHGNQRNNISQLMKFLGKFD